MHGLAKDMYAQFDKIFKAPKIFISHSMDGRPIVEKFVTMLEQMGVKQDQLFCSSIAGYGIPQGAGDLYDFTLITLQYPLRYRRTIWHLCNSSTGNKRSQQN